ncbi:hypothetical protein M378DRAFT_163506 [Amanita muscaria Koide BX008]|uniref:Uncharacterized protein n=1 Tax=Amanita muscaria (strain Koide BX008) TaxID=946122 RepID=A0A0C2X696_AMAMK|nr:hypothetical protein M378DRAFT_163506 [Amanita muscaria Koide BX008]
MGQASVPTDHCLFAYCLYAPIVTRHRVISRCARELDYTSSSRLVAADVTVSRGLEKGTKAGGRVAATL